MSRSVSGRVWGCLWGVFSVKGALERRIQEKWPKNGRFERPVQGQVGATKGAAQGQVGATKGAAQGQVGATKGAAQG